VVRKSQTQYLIPQYVHNQQESGNQLEEDQSPADNHQCVVEVNVIQKALRHSDCLLGYGQLECGIPTCTQSQG